jgi:hypothetical protein
VELDADLIYFISTNLGELLDLVIIDSVSILQAEEMQTWVQDSALLEMKM